MRPDDIRRILLLAAAGHPDAADEIDKLADQLRAQAARIRAGTANPMNSPGGMSDRVCMNVRGPDGRINKSVDTSPGACS